MQSILYHNSSGDLAFTGKLKSKEVHRAISMHPVKSPPHMYRLHNYMRVSVYRLCYIVYCVLCIYTRLDCGRAVESSLLRLYKMTRVTVYGFCGARLER